MTTIGDILDQLPDDVLAAAADEINRDGSAAHPLVSVGVPHLGSLRDIALGDVLREAWKDCRALYEAGRATVEGPETVRQVPLVLIEFSVEYRPVITIRIDAAEYHVGITIAFVLGLVDLLAVVQKGYLTHVACETMNASVALIVADREITSARERLPLDVRIRLGDGISLV